MNLEKIKELVFELMGNKRSHEGKELANKYQHGERVANLVLVLRKHILPNDDSHDKILTVAAWFHDIRNGKEDHANEGSQKTREVLTGFCSEYELDEICKIISVHDDRNENRSTFSDYIKLHQDADHLDHFGTFDVWSQFLYAVHNDQKMVDVIDWFQTTRRNNEKGYKEELNYELSKKIFDEKCEFVHAFGDRLSVEGMGGIWNEKELVEVSGYMQKVVSITKTKDEFEKSFAEDAYYNMQTQDHEHLNKIMSVLDIKENYKILDLGTGSGYLAFQIATTNPNSEIVGLDIVENAIEKNKSKAKEQNLKNLEFINYDGLILPFEANLFDIIVTRYALHHFPEIKKSFKEIARVLKPGGQLFIADPTPNDNDKYRFVDTYMQMKEDGHVKFYTQEEFTTLANNVELELESCFTTKIRFPRKNVMEYIQVSADVDDSIINGYHIQIIEEEVFITEDVLNLIYRKPG